MTIGEAPVRADLPIPLAPLRPWPHLIRRAATGLREPDFPRARDATLGWAIAAVVVLVSGETLVVPAARPSVLAVGAVLAAWTLVRVVALVAGERAQRRFEAEWIDTQTERLRHHAFEVIRLRVGDTIYDLDNPSDVARLRRWIATERGATEHLGADRADVDRDRVTVEFGYGQGGSTAIDRVSRDLADVAVDFHESPTARATVSFPAARYGVRPGGAAGHAWPGRRTYWFLAGNLSLRIAAPKTVAATAPAM